MTKEGDILDWDKNNNFLNCFMEVYHGVLEEEGEKAGFEFPHAFDPQNPSDIYVMDILQRKADNVFRTVTGLRNIRNDDPEWFKRPENPLNSSYLMVEDVEKYFIWKMSYVNTHDRKRNEER